MHALHLLLMLLIAVGAGTARAEAVVGLFEADVPISAEQMDKRDAAVRAGFAMVLVKVAGSRQVLDNPTVAAAIGKAGNYLEQYFFKRAETPLREGETEAQQLLHVSFQPAAVQQVLRAAGAAILSPNRPGVLLWMRVDDGTGPARIVNRETDADSSAWIAMHASRRGVPLLFPLLDVEDSQALGSDAIAALDSAPAMLASRRYGPAGVALASMRKVGASEWHGVWRLQLAEDTLDGSLQASSLEELGGQFVDFVAEAIAARHAIVPSGQSAEQVRLRIDGVVSFASYRQIEKLLKSLASVRELKLVLLDKDSLFFDVLTDTALDSLRQEIGLLVQLQPSVGSADFRYRWAGG